MNLNILRSLTAAFIVAFINLSVYAGDEHPNFSADDSRITYICTAKQVLDRVRKHNFEKNSGYDGVAYLGDNAWRVRTLAIRDLVRLGPEAKPALIAGLNDENRHVRHICVAAIGILGLREVENDLVKLLTADPDPIVRGQAAQALGQTGHTKAIEALKRASEQDDSKHVQHRAELAIGRLKQNRGNNSELIKAWTNLDEKTFRRAKTGKPAPDFELKDVYGKIWRLSNFKNKKTVVLVWIFADWCPVCNIEFHTLTQMEEQFKQADVQVFTIECHDQYRSGVMGKGKDLWWPHLVDNAGAVAAMYGVDPMEFVVHDEWINRPSTIIIDPKGIIRFAYYGTFWGDRPTIEQTLEMIKTNSYSFRHPERRE